MFEEFGEKAEAVAFDDVGGFDPGFVIGEAFLRRESAHPDIDALRIRFAFWIYEARFAKPAHFLGEEHHINVVVIVRAGGLAKGSERFALHGLFLA